jgi:hypothetical protein
LTKGIAVNALLNKKATKTKKNNNKKKQKKKQKRKREKRKWGIKKAQCKGKFNITKMLKEKL